MLRLSSTNREPFAHGHDIPHSEQHDHSPLPHAIPSTSPFATSPQRRSDATDRPGHLRRASPSPRSEPVAPVTHQGSSSHSMAVVPSPPLASHSTLAEPTIFTVHPHAPPPHEARDENDESGQLHTAYPRSRMVRMMPSPPPGPPPPGMAMVDLTPSWVYREQTGFFACYDVIHHTLGFLPLGDVRKCVGVCRFWEGIARERLGGRAEEIRQFVRVYNETVEDRVVRESNFVHISQARKAQLLFFSLNLCPCAILPWLYLKIPYEWPWCISDLAFDVCLGVCVSLTFLVAAIGMIKIGPKFGLGEIFIVAGGYLLVATAIVVYTLSQRFQVLHKSPVVNMTLSTLAAFTILVYSLPLLGATGVFLLYYLYTGNLIHRQQIRNPLSDAPEDNGGGYFAKLRRAVTLDEVELMMAKEAELKAKQETSSPAPAPT